MRSVATLEGDLSASPGSWQHAMGDPTATTPSRPPSSRPPGPTHTWSADASDPVGDYQPGGGTCVEHPTAALSLSYGKRSFLAGIESGAISDRWCVSAGSAERAPGTHEPTLLATERQTSMGTSVVGHAGGRLILKAGRSR